MCFGIQADASRSRYRYERRYAKRHAAKIGVEQSKANVISLINEIVVTLDNYEFLHEEEEWEWANVIDWSRDHGLCRAQVPCCTDPCPLALAQQRVALWYACFLYKFATPEHQVDWGIMRDAQRLTDIRPHPKYHTHRVTGLYVFPKGSPDIGIPNPPSPPSPVPPRYGLHVSERVFPRSQGPWQDGFDGPPYC